MVVHIVIGIKDGNKHTGMNVLLKKRIEIFEELRRVYGGLGERVDWVFNDGDG